MRKGTRTIFFLSFHTQKKSTKRREGYFERTKMKLSTCLPLIFIKLLLSPSLANAQTQECSAHPDPHFHTWKQNYYDYHGGCDLVLVQNTLLQLHIRTSPVQGYSFIQAAVLRIGSDTFEMTSGGTILMNGNSFSPPSTIGGFPLNQGPNYGSSSYEVLLDNGASIRFLDYSSYGLAINVYGDPYGFADSEGMCGKWDTAGLIDRDENTAADGNTMGESWRVQTALGDMELFQLPDSNSCTPAIGFDSGDGCVGGPNNQTCNLEVCLNCLEEGEAEAACASVPEGAQRDNCIFDVKTTGDTTEFPIAPFYDDTIPPPVDDRCTSPDTCQAHHEDATCVYNCVADSNFECLPDLCSESPSSGADNCACKAPKSDPNINGDPHIQTWSGTKYDFHGVCDLVLLQNPDFQKGLGMDIHVRTEQIKQFSYVSSAALRIGDDTLEVMGDLHKNLYWINKQANANLGRSIGGYPISYRKVNSKQHEFIVDLGGKKSIVLKTFKKFVRVSIRGATKESFGTSHGLLGSYRSGNLIARDKTTVFNDTDVFGQEWQVLPVEDMLFHNVEGPQAPEKCVIPTASTLRRRLVESNISEEEAERICARAASENFDLCVFDVMATGDKDVVGAY